MRHRAENRRFSTLKCTQNRRHPTEVECRLFVVQSCLTDADFAISSNYCLIGTRVNASRFLCAVHHRRWCRGALHMRPGRHLRSRGCPGRIYNPPLQGAARRGRCPHRPVPHMRPGGSGGMRACRPTVRWNIAAHLVGVDVLIGPRRICGLAAAAA